MNKMKKSLAIALGTAMASTAAINVQAADNPFSMKSLDAGYQVAMGKDKDGKKKEGSCGESKKKKSEGSCGAKKKEGSCGAKKKKETEGKCGGNK